MLDINLSNSCLVGRSNDQENPSHISAFSPGPPPGLQMYSHHVFIKMSQCISPTVRSSWHVLGLWLLGLSHGACWEHVQRETGGGTKEAEMWEN